MSRDAAIKSEAPYRHHHHHDDSDDMAVGTNPDSTGEKEEEEKPRKRRGRPPRESTTTTMTAKSHGGKHLSPKRNGHLKEKKSQQHQPSPSTATAIKSSPGRPRKSTTSGSSPTKTPLMKPQSSGFRGEFLI